jgi:hypothetical protein
MSNNQERIREIICHINQLLFELRLIQSNNNSLENFQPFNITINSLLTTMSHEKCLLDNNQCPYVSLKQAILHSTTYNEYKKIHQRKKLVTSSPKNNVFGASVCATSTPKNSPNQNILPKPYLTSTPRRTKRQSTNTIPRKRRLHNNNKDSNRQRHSAKRLVLPRYSSLHPIEENPQWI